MTLPWPQNFHEAKRLADEGYGHEDLRVMIGIPDDAARAIVKKYGGAKCKGVRLAGRRYLGLAPSNITGVISASSDPRAPTGRKTTRSSSRATTNAGIGCK